MTSTPPPADGAPPDPPQGAAASPGAAGPEGASAPPPAPAQDGAPQPGTPTALSPTGSAAWKPWTAPVALLLWFGVTILLSVVVAIVAAVLGYSLDDPPAGVNIANVFAQDLAMIGAVLAVAYFIAGRPRAADFGLRPARIGHAIGAMLAVWFGFIFFSLIWKVAISLDDPQTLPDQLGIDKSALNLVLVVIVITVLAPLGEELLFRGYLFRSLRNWRGFWPAAIITGVLFGAVHIGSSPIGYALPLAAFGFGLCVLYAWTGSLYPCIALHALNNAFALGVDKGWGWEIPLLMIGAATTAVAFAALLGRTLDRRAPAPAVAPLSPAT